MSTVYKSDDLCSTSTKTTIEGKIGGDVYRKIMAGAIQIVSCVCETYEIIP